MNPIVFAIAGYVALQLAIGFVASRRVASESDYLLAGRQLGYPLVVFSVFATWFGAETCVGSAGAIYAGGLSGSTADPFGYAVCVLLMGLVFAAPLWRKKLTTIADLLRERFSPGVEKLAVAIMIPTSILWAAAQIRAFGQVLSAASGVTVTGATVAAASVAVVYTVFGGLLADAVTDLVQGLVLAIGLVVLGIVVIGDAGGFSALWAQIEPARLELVPKEHSLWQTLEAWSVPIIGSLFAQELCARILAAKSPEVARRGTLIAAGLYFSIGLIPVLIGLAGPSLVPGLADPEHLLTEVARIKLGSVLYVVFVGALISAILSTVDSTLLVASSLLSHNVIVSLRPELPEAAKLRWARLGVVACGTVACVLALWAESVYSLVEEASAFGSAGISVCLVFGLFSRFGTARSAAACIVVGAVVYVVGAYVLSWRTPFVISLGASLLTYVAASVVRRG